MTTANTLRFRDALERLFWTFVSGFLSSLLAVPLLVEILENTSDVQIDLSAIWVMILSALVSGLTAAANALLILARWRLTVLPDPGRGMPGVGLAPPAPATPDPPRDAGRALVVDLGGIVGAAVVIYLAVFFLS